MIKILNSEIQTPKYSDFQQSLSKNYVTNTSILTFF